MVDRVSEGGGMVVPGFRPWHLVGAFSSKVGVLPQTAGCGASSVPESLQSRPVVVGVVVPGIAWVIPASPLLNGLL